MAAFAECAKVNSLWVVINCRQQNKQSKSLSEKVAVGVKMPTSDRLCVACLQ
jgi:hypothetical protein